jgi:hypothetical protein
MKPATLQTEQTPSTQLRKVVFGDSHMRTTFAMIIAGMAGLWAGVSAANASRVVVGGIYLDADLINAADSTQFRSYPNTGLYIHNGGTISGVMYGWLSLDPTQKEQMIGVWGANGPQSLELGYEADATGWQNVYLENYIPEGVQAIEVNANVSTTDTNGFASDIDAFATVPAADISGWTTYVDGFQNLSTNAINSIYPVYAPNLKGKDASGNAVDAWLMGGPGPNPFATGSFFADVRAMATYGGGITVDTPPQQFFHNIPGGTDGLGQAHYQAIAEGEVAWANTNNLHSIWIISPSTSGTNYNTIAQQLVRALEANATGSQQNIPSEYVVENYGTSSSIENNNPIGSETQPNSELGVALWLAGYEQGRTGDLQLTPAGLGSTQLNITSQTPTALGGEDTTVALPAAGLPTSSYSVVLHNTSTNSSNWYIPNLSGIQTGESSDWSVRIVLNPFGVDITSNVMGNGGFTFNASAITANAGLVVDPGVQQTMTFTFEPLNANAASDPYSFELTGLAHPGASDAFGSVTFAVVPQPSAVTIINTVLVGGNIQFSFLSAANTTNYVQYTTNLANTNWLNYSTIVGDGTLQTVNVPASTPAATFFRILTP